MSQFSHPAIRERCATCHAWPGQPCTHAALRMPLGLTELERIRWERRATLKNPHRRRREAVRVGPESQEGRQ